jgi:iron complex outermembrane receptor protein
MRGYFGSGSQRHLMTGAAMVVVMAVASPAFAQAKTFNIPAQSAATSIPLFARQAGIQLLARSEAVRGKRTNAVRGSLGVEEALGILLKGTGLTVGRDNGTGILIIRSAVSDTPLGERPAGSAAADDESADIVVTGSRIRGAPPTSPVVSETREGIRDAGITDLGDYARTLTQNYSGGQNPGVSSNQGSRNDNLNNSSALNLRGLGADATLTLINGHRVAYDGLLQGVDISALPLAAIERVEIVADGASALYGSDAVGGVANIILRRDFDGVVTSARFGVSTDGGNEQQQYNAVTGKRWASGGFMAAVDYSHFTEISARDRSYTRTLDDSATLVPRQKQISFVVAGHQEITSGVQLEIDGQYNNRKSANALATLATSSAFTSGLYVTPKVTSYTITPTLRFQLPGEWQASLSGTHGNSKTDSISRTFSQGLQTRRTRLVYSNDVDAAEITAEGPLFHIPGGDVRLAVGGGYRSLSLDVNVARTPTGGVTTISEKTGGSRDVAFGYGELSIPLVGAANAMPFMERLRLNGAVRYERYKNIGDVAVPKIGLIYKPHNDVTISASWGKSFKAPTLYQSYQVRYGNLTPGEFFFGFPADRAVLVVAGGNDSLHPERATTWTTSIEIEPSFLDGFKIEASYFDIRFRNRAVSPITDTLNAFNDPTNGEVAIRNPTAQQIAAELARLPQGAQNFTGLPDNAVIIGGILDGSLQNAARQTVKGVDLALRYQFELSPEETFQLSASGSYQESERQLAAGKPIIQLTGLIFNPPHWRGRIGGTYQRDNVSFSAFGSYIGGTLDNRIQPMQRIGSFKTLDAVMRVKTTASGGVFRGVDATLAITNFLNEKPDIIRNTNPADRPYDSTNYSVAGRVISLTISKAW